jgi:hypothetical protein
MTRSLVAPFFVLALSGSVAAQDLAPAEQAPEAPVGASPPEEASAPGPSAPAALTPESPAVLPGADAVPAPQNEAPPAGYDPVSVGAPPELVPDAPAHAEPPPTGPVTQHLQLSLNFDTVIHKDPSFDVFAPEDSTMLAGVSASYAFWLTDVLSVAPEIGYAGDALRREDLLGGSLRTAEVTSYGAYAGASARYELWGVFAPHVRIAAGAARTHFTLHFDTDGTFENAEWLPFVTLGAGASVTTPDRFFQTQSGKFSSFALGLTVEGGYWASSPLTVGLEREDARARLPLEQPSLGDLSRSGPYVRIALLARL